MRHTLSLELAGNASPHPPASLKRAHLELSVQLSMCLISIVGVYEKRTVGGHGGSGTIRICSIALVAPESDPPGKSGALGKTPP